MNDFCIADILTRVSQIADFGLSRVVTVLTSESSVLHTALGRTAAWAAPEVFEEEKSSRASDVYSFAIVYWEVLTLEVPWRGKRGHAIMHSVCIKNERPQLPPDTPAKIKKIITKCWSKERKKRPTFEEVEKQLAMPDAGWGWLSWLLR
ncbi:unnamed protein product [Choristocarpus tenellus]